MSYQRSASSTVALSALAERVYELLDNPAFLGAHKEEPSVMMLGASMRYDLDEAEGRAVGSVIRMRGGYSAGRSPWKKSSRNGILRSQSHGRRAERCVSSSSVPTVWGSGSVPSDRDVA